jgi:hypothetical protein
MYTAFSDAFGVDYGFRTQIWGRLRQDSGHTAVSPIKITVTKTIMLSSDFYIAYYGSLISGFI